MPKEQITRYSVDTLIEARKLASHTRRNTLYSGDPKQNEACLRIDVRRVDSPGIDLTLEFYGRIMRKTLAGVSVVQRPSASLIWHGKRIRGLDHSLKHDVVENGIVTGFIRGWHEHYWTDSDEDNAIREPNPPMKNSDMQAVIGWCSRQWNIEGIGETMELFDE